MSHDHPWQASYLQSIPFLFASERAGEAVGIPEGDLVFGRCLHHTSRMDDLLRWPTPEPEPMPEPTPEPEPEPEPGPGPEPIPAPQWKRCRCWLARAKDRFRRERKASEGWRVLFPVEWEKTSDGLGSSRPISSFVPWSRNLPLLSPILATGPWFDISALHKNSMRPAF